MEHGRGGQSAGFGGERARVLADPEWLATHLHDEDLRVIEVDVSPAPYDDWHIDGAVLWNIYSDLKDPDYRLVDADRLESLFVRSGLTPKTTVVFYGYAPAFGFWLLNLFGHASARVLNCSRDTWRAAGHPWTSVAQPPPKGSYRLGDPVAGIRADRQAVLAAIDSPSTTLLDVRSTSEYQGERFWPSGAVEPGGRAGHVPSAVHQPVDGLFCSDGSLRPDAELRSIFPAVNFDGEEELVTYCTIGGRAATAWFVLTHLLGRNNVSVYDGSWAEWGRLPDVPVEPAHSSIATLI